MQPTAPLPIALTEADVLPSLGKILIVYGPLGLMTLIALYVTRHLYRDMRSDRTAYAAALKAKEDSYAIVVKTKEDAFTTQLKVERDACELERKKHSEELDKLRDRYIEKADTWNAKNQENLAAINKVLDSVFKSRSGSNGGG